MIQTAGLQQLFRKKRGVDHLRRKVQNNPLERLAPLCKRMVHRERREDHEIARRSFIAHTLEHMGTTAFFQIVQLIIRMKVGVRHIIVGAADSVCSDGISVFKKYGGAVDHTGPFCFGGVKLSLTTFKHFPAPACKQNAKNVKSEDIFDKNCNEDRIGQE